MIAALLWWFIALNNQNIAMANMRIAELNKDDPAYLQKLDIINNLQKRKTAQYIGEGVTFFVLILIGAVFIYRATRKQIKLSQQQQNFMMAVTHELKTPIAITQLNLETLQKRKLEETQQQKLINNTLQEAGRLNTLCNNILLAAQFDAGVYKKLDNWVNLSTLTQKALQQYNNRFPQKNITQNISADIQLKGEEILLEMLVNNLLENAIKYTQQHHQIMLNLLQKDNQVILQVIDNGNGIAPEDKKRIFEKFYRSGNEKTRTTKGTGLGLYLCKKIVEIHNGQLTLTDNHPTGSIFTATFNTV
jgi:K+-sensing histidine kinase KdpD